MERGDPLLSDHFFSESQEEVVVVGSDSMPVKFVKNGYLQAVKSLGFSFHADTGIDLQKETGLKS